MKKNDMNISSIRLRGNQALFKALGPMGFVRYMQQFVTRGDYTQDREKWVDQIDLSDLEAQGEKRTGAAVNETPTKLKKGKRAVG